MRRLTIGSLFSGIGGLELGLERAGLGPTLWQIEKDEFCRAVLAKHWPDAERFDDVATIHPRALPYVDVFCGGFPCQDLSVAGKREGLAGKRSGLWRHYARLVRAIRPPFVVVENVPGLVSLGLERVLGDLAESGYDAEWGCLRASDVGAPHLRERLFIIGWLADPLRERRKRRERAGQEGEEQPGHERPVMGGALADTNGDRQPQRQRSMGEERQRAVDGGRELADARCVYLREQPGRSEAGARAALAGDDCEARRGGAEPRVGREADGVSRGLDRRWPAAPGEAQHEGEPPRTAQGVANRPARLRAMGNANVPQVAEVVGRRLLQIAGQHPIE